MKYLMIAVNILALSSAAMAGECDVAAARESAAQFFKTRTAGPVYLTTAAEAKAIKVGDELVKGNLVVKYAMPISGRQAEIGEIELHPSSCKVVNLNSSSALSL